VETDPDPVSTLDAGARLTLRPLSITPHEQEFLVGDPAAGEFVTMPEIGVMIIGALRDGLPLDAVAEIARERAGEEVDVVDFAETLMELGFVDQIDGRPLPDQRTRRADGGRIGRWLARAARPLFSRVAWLLYGGLFLACTGLLVADPSVRPHGSDLLFLHNPVYSVGCMFIIGMLLAAAHESAHWLAARVEGVPASISISRRLYLLVLQTDLTGIWALPRRKRLSPLLAGMALETIGLAILLAARVSATAGEWHPTPTLSRLIMALIASTVAGIVFQFFIFLRTDLYAVLITSLGCVNLTRVTRLLIRQSVTHLRERERDELEQSSARDLQVARWYRWLYLAGMIAASWFLVSFFGPNIVTVARWTMSSLERTSPSHPSFWEGLVLGSLALAPVPLTIGVFIRERARAHVNPQ
jgi:hypothetical protein